MGDEIEMEENKYADDYISDSDNDEDISSSQGIIDYYVSHRSSPDARRLDRFFDENNFIVSGNDPKNFWSQGCKPQKYNVNKRYLPRFFDILNQCRIKNIPVNITEYQYTPNIPDDKTGLYIDFDIKQNKKDIIFGEDEYVKILEIVIDKILQILDFGEDKTTTFAGITVRPTITRSNDRLYWKFGFHIIIPGIKVSKRVKQYLYQELNTNSNLILVMKQLEDVGLMIDPKYECIDINSAHVPVLLVGSAKINRKPYDMKYIYKISIDKHGGQTVKRYFRVTKNDTLLQNSNFNSISEFCLSCTPVNPFIIRKSYDIKKELSNNIVNIKLHKYNIKEDTLTSDINDLKRKHYDIDYLMIILDIIAIDIESYNYGKWSTLFAVLSKQGDEYKCLAKYFSMKSVNWQEFENQFEENWSKAREPAEWKKTLHLTKLYTWAREVNPKEYIKARVKSVHNIIYDKVTDSIKMGYLGDSDWAEILYKFLKDKYVVDYDTGNSERIWYEFITKNDRHKKGELWKWRKYAKGHPESLHQYISRELTSFCETILESLTRKIEDHKPDAPVEIKTWLIEVKKNFKSSIRKLYNYTNKIGIIRECTMWFSQYGFNDNLDNHEMILGVGQGLLILDRNGGKEKLITEENDFCISRFTSINYPQKGFDPTDPKTKKLLLALRNMFPNNEPSTHLYMMCYLASTLDKRMKSGLFLICTGDGQQGKSFMMEIHRNMLQDANTHGSAAKMRISTITSNYKSSEGPDPNIMQLVHARIAHYSESQEGDILNTAKMKDMTSGETMTGRYLNQNMQSFKPTCQQIMTTNHDLIINDTDWGTWRRIKIVPFKMRFYDPKDISSLYEPENPFHKPGDSELMDKNASDPEYASKWMSIMVFYHRILMIHFNGKVNNIPHPIILEATQEYRNSQDNINRFIHQRMVKFTISDELKARLLKKYYPHKVKNEEGKEGDDDDETPDFSIDPQGTPLFPLSKANLAYKNWYNETIKIIKHKTSSIDKMFIKKSQLKKYIKETRNDGWVIVGWRALEDDEKVGSLERFNITIKKNNIDAEKSSYILPKSETPAEYLDRIVREFKEMEDGNNKIVQYPVIIDKQKREYLGIQPTCQSSKYQSRQNKYRNNQKTGLCDIKINKSILSKASNMDIF